MTAYFVWVDGPNGPWPQKWYDNLIKAETGKAYEYLQKQVLTEEESSLSINELKIKYPLNKE